MKLLMAILLCGFSWGAHAEEVEIFSPKLAFRLGSGILVNTGTVGGSTLTTGGLNFVYTYFLTGSFALVAGYRADFDTQRNILPIYGFDFGSRLYYWGQGTRSLIKIDSTTSERHDLMALYAIGELSSKTFYLGSNPKDAGTTSLTGNFVSLNVGTGLDLRVSRHFELNSELTARLISLSASDNRIRLKAYLLSLGVSYLF